MPLLEIEIELGNDEMQTGWQVAKSVNHALVGANPYNHEPLQVGEKGTIADRNGNTVGKWKVEKD